MIYESYEYRELLSAFANQYINVAPLFSEIWINTRDVMEVFKVFNDATYTFNLVYVPTSHIFCYTALQVAVAVALSSGLQIESIQNAVGEMRLKWLQYYKVIPDTCCHGFRPEMQVEGSRIFFVGLFSFIRSRR